MFHEDRTSMHFSSVESNIEELLPKCVGVKEAQSKDDPS